MALRPGTADPPAATGPRGPGDRSSGRERSERHGADSARRLRPTLIVALAALVWASVATGLELHRFAHRRSSISILAGDAARWRLGVQPASRMRRLLQLSAPLVPEGRSLAFAGAAGWQGYQELLWATYLLPEWTVRPYRPQRPGGQLEAGDYVVSWRRELKRRGVEVILHTDDGVLYRVRP